MAKGDAEKRRTSTAYKQGKKAHRNGMARGDNPYDPGLMRENWDMGWGEYKPSAFVRLV